MDISSQYEANISQYSCVYRPVTELLPVRMKIFFILLILLNTAVPQTIESEAFIKVTRFQVPPVARVGDTVRLACVYELSGETLHAMKLFKDNKEFYRYTPTQRREDQKMAFPVPGVSVELARSNERDVWLRSANKRTAGLFKCQVSVEGTFKSISAEKRMEVVARSQPESLAGGASSVGGGSNRQQQQRHTVQQQQQLSQYYGGQMTSMPIQGQQQHQLQSNSAAGILAHAHTAIQLVFGWYLISTLIISSPLFSPQILVSTHVHFFG